MTSPGVSWLSLAALLCVAGDAALAEGHPPLTSAYSEISRTRCPNDFNKPLSQLGEHQSITYSCPGRGGLAVDVSYRGASVEVVFRRQGERTALARLGAGHDVGEKVEWRGVTGARGFAPGAAILRLRNREGAKKFGDVLGILRVEGDQVCAAAFIDAGAVPDSNALARRIADDVAENFHCGKGEAKIVGAVTERATEALSRGK